MSQFEYYYVTLTIPVKVEGPAASYEGVYVVNPTVRVAARSLESAIYIASDSIGRLLQAGIEGSVVTR